MKTRKKKVKERPSETCIIHFFDVRVDKFVEISSDKLAKVKEIATKRQSLPPGSEQRLNDICERIPEFLSEGDGYHRQCYKRFSSHLERLNIPDPALSKENDGEVKVKRKSGEQGDHIKFKHNCIFCGREGKKGKKKH